MSGLQRQVVPVMLKGLDQLAPRQTGIMSGLDALLNLYAQQGEQAGYEFVPRPGTTAITQPGGVGGTVGQRFAVLRSQLHLISDSALWRRANDAVGWHSAATGFSISSQQTAPIFCGNTTPASVCDSAYVNGFAVSVAISPLGSVAQVCVTIRDSAGAVVTSALVSAPAATAAAARIAVSGNFAIIFWHDGSTSIKCIKFDGTTGVLNVSPTTVDAVVSVAFTPVFDVQTIPSTGSIVVAWNDNGTSNLTQALVAPSTMAVSGKTAYGAKGTNFVTKGYLANGFSTNVIFLSYISSATGLHVDTFDGTTLGTVASNTADATSTAGANITGWRDTGGALWRVYYTLKATNGYDNQIRIIAGFGASAQFMYARSIASKAMNADGSTVSTPLPLMLTKYTGPGQATYFMIDTAGKDMSIAFPDVSANDPTNTMAGLLCLPGIMNAGASTTYLTSGLRSISLQSTATGFSESVGAATIQVKKGDPNVGSPVEINGALQIPGALPLYFDGGTLVENGFPLAPEQSDAYVLAGGGAMTASATYQYRYLYEWIDNNGNLYQSAPSLLAQQAVLGPGQTQVTHAIPNTLNTRKALVNIIIVRTPANGDGSVYYKVGSVATQTFAAPVPGRVAFVDQMSDAVLVTGVPLYTDGGILENISPPACMTMAVHRGRLLVGGIDADPTAVWFSKQVANGFGVHFNDGLVSRLGGSTDLITALGSMDSFAAAFTGTTTWTSSDDYPDDTGAPGVLRFSQSSSTNGCAGARLIARADDGLTCWQAKTAVTGGPGPGPWRLSRGLAWEWIGRSAQLDAAAFTSPRTILAVPGLNQMRIVGQAGSVNGNVLVRETTFETWSTWTYLVSPSGAPTIVDAVVWGSAVAYLGTDGHVLLENTSLYSDSATSIAHSLTLSPFNFAGVAGYQRIYVGQLTGRLVGDVGLGESLVLNVTQTIDGTAMAPKVRTLTPDANGLFGGVEFDPGPNGKCSAYQLTISNAAGGANDSRCAWTLAAVTMEVGIKPNVNRLSPANRAL